MKEFIREKVTIMKINLNFLREKVTIMKINLNFLQMLHRGKLYIDSLNINLHNFTLVTASKLNVNGGRIWAHERRTFWYTNISNNPGRHEIRWKEDFRMTRPNFEYIVHQNFVRKERYTIQKSNSSKEKGGSCLLDVGNRKQLPFYWKKGC